MAANTPKQVAGKHYPLFETYYVSLDPSGKGQVAAMEAAKFLKRSALSDAILSKIWDLSDPNGKGYLDKLGVYVALKLVAFAQNGRDVTLSAILDDNVPEPEMNAVRAPVNTAPRNEPIKPPQPVTISPGGDWNIKEADMIKYKQIYCNLGPENGKIPGGKAKSMLIDSKLPVDTLGKIWDLADADKDGSLSEMEFVIALQLVYKCLEKVPLPTTLPLELQQLLDNQRIPTPVPIKPLPVDLPRPQSQQHTLIPQSGSMSSSIDVLGIQSIQQPMPAPAKDNWVVPYDERAKFKALFHSTDLDLDGYVSGGEIKGVFLQSGLSQQTLAHIWNLCDFDQSGKLDCDQFTLAMWLVSNALRGINPPSALAPEMFPPGVTPPEAPVEPALPPEFESMMKEINELTQEKLALEMEIAAKECDKKIKNGETRSLQAELDTLVATLKQLENQKSVAHGKLSELDGQVSALRFQAEEQEVKLSAQESELSSKAKELDAFDAEEVDLKNQLVLCGKDIEKLGILLQETLLQISQSNTRLTGLVDVEQTMKVSIAKYTSAIDSNNAYTVTEPELRDVKSEFDELIGSTSPSMTRSMEDTKDKRTTNGFPQNFDAFGPPQTNNNGSSVTSWDHDPFAPVKSSDSFSRNEDPFAPSGNSAGFSPGFSSDPFGSVPFEAEVAPALPPKKGPPRPAPPKNVPARPPPPAMRPPPPQQQPKQDPFSQGDQFGDGGFADFSQFDSQDWTSSFNNSTINHNGKTISNLNNNHNARTRGTTRNNIVSPPQLEFTEDPFKNYRYEDPFENSDPFAS